MLVTVHLVISIIAQLVFYKISFGADEKNSKILLLKTAKEAQVTLTTNLSFVTSSDAENQLSMKDSCA